MAVACAMDFLEDLSSAHCSARRFSCQPRRLYSLPAPPLLPEGQDDGTGTLGRPHHTWQGMCQAVSRFPTPAPQLQARSQPLSISLWALWIYSKKPKAASLIRHKRSRTLPMAQISVTEVSQHNPASPPSVPVYAVKHWQAPHWHQIQHALHSSEQRAGLAPLLLSLWTQRTCNFWNLKMNLQHFIRQLLYIQHPGDVSEYFWITGDYLGIQTAGRNPCNQDACSLPPSAEIPRATQSVQPLRSAQLLPSRKGYWAGCSKLPGSSPISRAVNLVLLLEPIIFSWWQSTGTDWTVCLAWEHLNSWKDAQCQGA